MSLKKTLTNLGVCKTADMRLNIDIASLRQRLQACQGQETGDPLYGDYLPRDNGRVNRTDPDVSSQILSPKLRTHRNFDTTELDVERPLDSIVTKRAKQLQGRKMDSNTDPLHAFEEVQHTPQ